MINKKAFTKENLVNKKIALINLKQVERNLVEQAIRKSGVMIGKTTIIFKYAYIFLNEHSNATFSSEFYWFNGHRYQELKYEEMFKINIKDKLK